MDNFSFLNAAHTAHFAALYDQYLQQPDTIEPSWRAFFQGFDFGLESSGSKGTINSSDSDDTNTPAPNAVVGNVNQIPGTSSYSDATTSEAIIEKTNVDNIDIPAFLRQQAD